MNAQKYIEGVYAIFNENPAYKIGHDGSDGYCDCIGMCKGAIRRGGETPNGLQGTNYAARYTIQNLKRLTGSSELKPGDVVLKSKEPGESGYSLPDSYKPGGSNYNGDLRDYSHIGTVTKNYPLEITHMTSPKAKKDTKLGNWKWFGQLPQVKTGGVEPVAQYATVTAPSGSTVNMRAQPSTKAALVERVPVGSTVEVLDNSGAWCKVRWSGKSGYMMTEFLLFEESEPALSTYTVIIEGLSKADATALVEKYPSAVISIG